MDPAVILRDERAEDARAIQSLTARAFAGKIFSDGTEASIPGALRSDRALTLSLVADKGGEVVGHVAFSSVTVDGVDVNWFGLGPVSVRPDLQRLGIGGALIREGLGRLRGSGARGCVLLGDPGYYARFGFVAEPALTYPGPPAKYFQSLVFQPPIPAGEVAFHPAFGAG